MSFISILSLVKTKSFNKVRDSLTLKMILITIIVGAIVGGITDISRRQFIKEIFRKELNERLITSAKNDRQDFDNYINAHNRLVKLLVSFGNFEHYVNNNNWDSSSKIEIKYYDTLPQWLPKSSILRSFVRIRTALLIDHNGIVREIYKADDFKIPDEITSPSKHLLEISLNQNLMTMINEIPYLITAESLKSDDSTKGATLMLVCPIDKEFLRASQPHIISNSYIALLSGTKLKVLISSSPDIIKTGMFIDDLSKDFLITGKTFFDYGSSDLYLQFTSLISIQKEHEMIDAIVNNDREHNFVFILIFILSFSFLMILLIKRINKMSSHIADFSQQVLGVNLDNSSIGDDMAMLEDRFNLLVKEISLSRDKIKKNTDDLESRIIERTVELRLVNSQLLSEIEEKIKIESHLKYNYMITSTISAILQVSLHPIPLKAQLNEILKLIFLVEWLSLESQGSIFLIDDEHEDMLRLEVQNGLSLPLLELCARVPFGKCHCGIAAQTRKISFTNCIDDDHSIRFEGMKPHGHYCIPIISGDNLLGVINLYVKSDHIRNIEEEGFLLAVANTLAGIIDRKKMEEQLITSSKRLEETNEELKTITYLFSHDIRAPLVNLKGFVSELSMSLHELEVMVQDCSVNFDEKHKQNFATILKEDIPESLDFITSSTSRIDYLSNAVLRLSRLGFVELTYEKIDMESLIESVLKSLGHQIASKNVKIVKDAKLPEITADRTAIEQIIGNIIDNAIKYLVNDRQGIIEISASATNKETVFHIKDNGRGIPLRDNEKVFAVFRRAGTQDVAGEGMGLSYVKTLLRRHNGRIWFESIDGQGTTFHFAIPKGMS